MFNSLNGLSQPRPQPANDNSGNDIVNSVKNGETLLVDVRGHDEVAASGKAEGALHVPLMLLQYHADPRHPEFQPAFGEGKPIAVYCASGGRSSMAAQILRQLGHDDVTNIGGLGDWVAAGGKVA